MGVQYKAKSHFFANGLEVQKGALVSDEDLKKIEDCVPELEKKGILELSNSSSKVEQLKSEAELANPASDEVAAAPQKKEKGSKKGG